MEEMEAKKKAAHEEKNKKEQEVEALKKKMASTQLSESEMAIIKKGLSELEREAKDASVREKEVMNEEKKMPLNVDTISKPGFSKSIINKNMPRTNEHLTEEERETKMRDFVTKYEKELKAFGWLNKYDDSKAYMLEKPHLACEEAANFLVIHCLNLEMQDKHGAMEQVAHQCICIQYLLELSKQLDVDPRSCISSFFTKIQIADPEYEQAFDDELVAFIERIEIRAKEKIAEQIADAEKEEERELDEGKADRIKESPGGLDPIEVLESLPEDLRRCFEEQDTAMLQEVIRKLGEKDARYHMKRCVDSGLWKPAQDDPETNPEDGFRKAQSEEGDADNEEEHYEDPSKLNQK